MRKLFCLFFALLALCLPARAIELPDGLNGAVPDELLESAQEEGLMTRGAAYLWEMLRASLGGAVRS